MCLLAFFEGVSESDEITQDCAFPLAKPNTNLSSSLFQRIGYDTVVCHDGIFRKCQRIRCKIEYNGMNKTTIFHLDDSLMGSNMTGVITQSQSEMLNNKKLHQPIMGVSFRLMFQNYTETAFVQS